MRRAARSSCSSDERRLRSSTPAGARRTADAPVRCESAQEISDVAQEIPFFSNMPIMMRGSPTATRRSPNMTRQGSYGIDYDTRGTLLCTTEDGSVLQRTSRGSQTLARLGTQRSYSIVVAASVSEAFIQDIPVGIPMTDGPACDVVPYGMMDLSLLNAPAGIPRAWSADNSLSESDDDFGTNMDDLARALSDLESSAAQL